VKRERQANAFSIRAKDVTLWTVWFFLHGAKVNDDKVTIDRFMLKTPPNFT